MDFYTRALEFFVENGIELDSSQIKKLKNINESANKRRHTGFVLSSDDFLVDNDSGNGDTVYNSIAEAIKKEIKYMKGVDSDICYIYKAHDFGGDYRDTICEKIIDRGTIIELAKKYNVDIEEDLNRMSKENEEEQIKENKFKEIYTYDNLKAICNKIIQVCDKYFNAWKSNKVIQNEFNNSIDRFLNSKNISLWIKDPNEIKKFRKFWNNNISTTKLSVNKSDIENYLDQCNKYKDSTALWKLNIEFSVILDKNYSNKNLIYVASEIYAKSIPEKEMNKLKNEIEKLEVNSIKIRKFDFNENRFSVYLNRL